MRARISEEARFGEDGKKEEIQRYEAEDGRVLVGVATSACQTAASLAAGRRPWNFHVNKISGRV